MAYQQTFIAQVWPMIKLAMETVAPIYDGRVYSIVPPRNTSFPALSFQSQDLGGNNDDTIGNNGWNGVITIKSIDSNEENAHNKLALALQQLAGNPVTVSGILTLSGEFTVQMEQLKPIIFPVERLTDQESLYQAAVMVTVFIKPVV